MKILQIIPAQPGWNVAYKTGTCKWSPAHEEAGGVEFVPVACWALVQDPKSGGARVIPMTGGESGAALVPQDVDNTKALGISPPGRRPRDWTPKLRRSEGGTRKIEKLEKARPKPKLTPEPAPKRADPEKVAEVQEAISAPSISTAEAETLPLDAETTKAPAITLDEVMDSSYTVSEPVAKSDEMGIPSGDVLDLDF